MEHNEEEKINKQRQKKEKQKRDFKILIGLAIIALLFIVISLVIIFKSNNKDTENPVNNNEVQVDNELPVEESKQTSEDDEDDELVTEENAETDKKSDDEKINDEDLTTPISSDVYANNKMRITYSIPDSWKGKVQIYEDKTTMEFFYKEENLFLTVKTVTQGEYDDYYSGVYNIATKKGGIVVIYLLPNEHPLARAEGSEDYHELTAIMSDNYNFIKTIKIN